MTEILRSNRLEAWGEMARQAAHEIKNPLTPIQLTAEHLRAVAERKDPSLPSVVRSAVENILRQVRTLEIASSTPTAFAGDARMLRGAVANLIENALQAAPGGRVRLDAWGVDSKVVISVEDNGPESIRKR